MVKMCRQCVKFALMIVTVTVFPVDSQVQAASTVSSSEHTSFNNVSSVSDHTSSTVSHASSETHSNISSSSTETSSTIASTSSPHSSTTSTTHYIISNTSSTSNSTPTSTDTAVTSSFGTTEETNTTDSFPNTTENYTTADHSTAPSTHEATSTTTTITTSTTVATTKKDSNNNKSLAVAVSLAVVLPLIIIIIIVAVYFNRRLLRRYARKWKMCDGKLDDSESGEITLPIPTYTSRVVSTDEFLEYLEEMQKESDFRYAEQFEHLQLVGREQSTDNAMLKCNVDKNRYCNIHPYDLTRVKLLPVENEDGTDYINASWVPGYYSKREYIAAQGPLPGTQDDMWRMIWEYNCRGIVMLTRCMEAGRKKCDQYWPDDTEPIVYGDIEVTLIHESTDQWPIKTLQMALGQQKQTLKLFQFLEWPDSGTPESPQTFLDFMRTVQAELETTKTGPLVIHCSAGVGRTGTYIAIETLLQQLENERKLDVFGVVYKMRMNRVFMVQTEGQYKFIHQTVGHVIQQQNQGETTDDTSELNHDSIELYANAENFQPQEASSSHDKGNSEHNVFDNKAFESSNHSMKSSLSVL